MSTVPPKDVISDPSFTFQYLVHQRKSSVTMQNTLPAEYMEFAANRGFSSTIKKGHSFIERQVQTIQKLLARCDEDGTNYHLALQEL